MLRIHRGTLLKAAMPAALSMAALSVAAVLAAGGSQAALASPATATAGVTSAVATGVRAAHAPDGYYAMRLSRSSVAVRAGHRTSIAISFLAPAALYGVPVALDVSGLPAGVTVRGHRHRDVAEQRPHRHHGAAEPHRQRALRPG